MMLPWRSIRLLQRAVNLWLFGYLFCSLWAAEWLWVHPAVPALPPPPGMLASLTHAFAFLPTEWAIGAVILVMVLALRSVVLPARWYFTAIQWMLFSSLINLAWLTSTGGHQLIANVLFWMILLPAEEPTSRNMERGQVAHVVYATAGWIVRLQLILAYGVTGIQKLTGIWWVTGDAMGIVATDTSYGPAWLAAVPWFAGVVNHAVLFFQLTFPVAVWWRRTRPWWMAMGILFHLSTGLAFGILDMGLAFLAVYPIWFRGGEVDLPVQVRSEDR